MEKSKRITFLDTIRGLTILCMIVYHALYDIHYIFDFRIPFFESYSIYIFQQAIASSFILISGSVSNLTNRGVKRGITVFLCAIGITIVTYIFIPSEVVKFGILHFMGLAMIITALLKKYLSKVNAFLGVSFSFLLFMFTKQIYYGYLGFGDLKLIKLPDFLYTSKIAFPLGFPKSDFFSSDYFPIIPWIFLYFTGFYGFKILKNKIKASKILNKNIFILTTLGKNSLQIYLIHQVLIYMILYILNAIYSFTFI